MGPALLHGEDAVSAELADGVHDGVSSVCPTLRVEPDLSYSDRKRCGGVTHLPSGRDGARRRDNYTSRGSPYKRAASTISKQALPKNCTDCPLASAHYIFTQRARPRMIHEFARWCVGGSCYKFRALGRHKFDLHQKKEQSVDRSRLARGWRSAILDAI